MADDAAARQCADVGAHCVFYNVCSASELAAKTRKKNRTCHIIYWSADAPTKACADFTHELLSAIQRCKRELALEGDVTSVVRQAASQLDIDPGAPLVELARQCLRELSPGA